MTSEIGTDLRAVWLRGVPITAVVHVCGRGPFGEIAPSRRRSGKVEFVAGTLEGDVGFVAGLRDVAQ